ncbi:MAG: hypothetical protein JSV52_10720 [Candidatus Zixiibacteriota bacterium]|nr:MAG: hypothetical protein JSV52_10720 [candidate division Zixibacteria bacterium]
MKRNLRAFFLFSALAFFSISAVAQDMPHEDINFECEVCHSLKEWSGVRFDHADSTGFVLEGRHASAECKGCHTLTDFSIIDQQCVACHKDIHEAKLGPDCARCHTPDGFTIFNIEDIHAQTNFPLMGRHALADCQSCHRGLPRGDLSFETTRCVGCHQQNYLEAASPNHVSAGFSTDCDNCHQMSSWHPAMITEHDIFFPIFSGEHAGEWDDCSTCHINPDNFAEFSCFGCHEHNQTDTDADHVGIPAYNYNSEDCYLCHPRGTADEFVAHDALYFPIYTGAHAAVWDDCSDCHIDPNDKSVFSCTVCHGQSETNPIHGGITSYVWESSACLTCHPTGSGGEYTEHDVAYFPIYTGTHGGTWDDCTTCHTNPADRSEYTCLVCHPQGTIDPIHLGMTSYSYVSTACFSCHPQGVVEDYLEHDADFFPIYSGTHSGEWSDCSQCHTDPADKSVVSCLTCHDQTTTDEIHSGITSYTYETSACLTCHPTGSGGEFTEHDVTYFPIYSGTHSGAWSDCAQCHINPADRTEYDCLGCHLQGTIDVIHQGMTSYSYLSTVCFTCHPQGVVENYLEHDADFFPIYSGDHSGAWAECATCHTDPANRSVFTCLVCHDQGTVDPIHLGMLSYSYESSVCYSCHPAGVVEDYTEHDAAFFPIYSGAHSGTWVDCSTCHTDPGDKSVFTCLVCHNQTDMDNMHVGISGYVYNSTDCLTCHPDGSEIEFTEHELSYFPIYSGAHAGVWAECATCHTVPGDRTIYDCLACHDQTSADGIHLGMPEYFYQSDVCYSCHPQGVPEDYPQHDVNGFFPIYSGNHAGVWAECATCHTDPTSKTVFTCLVCHEQAVIEPYHLGMPSYLYESNACYSCHPNGIIEDYLEHDDEGFFPIYSGTHDGRWTSCATCHIVPTDKSVFSCLETCHQNPQTDNWHTSPTPVPGYTYDSEACYACHPRGEYP